MDPSLLPSLAWFALVARHRSFTRAAEEMGVSRAAVSQSMKLLERALGVRLLHRTTREMSLTEEGDRLLATLGGALGEIERAVKSVGEARQAPSGMVRVNTSRLAARTLIEPRLPEFYARYPEVRLELVLADSLSNIIAEGCDAGIRLGPSLAEHVVAVPISPPVAMVVVASPDYLRRRGVPDAPGDLANHNCINYRYPGSGAVREWEFYEPGAGRRRFTRPVAGNLLANDDQAMTRAAVAGIGLIQAVDLAVQERLADGTLVQVLATWAHAQPGFHLYVHSREHLPAKVRALIDFLKERRRQRLGSRQGVA